MSEGRCLKVNVLRYNPQLEGDQPRFVTYEVDEAENMTLYMVLTEIREEQEPSLHFDFVCRAGICGSCAMLIDGRPGLACRTLTSDLETEFTLAPLPIFGLIADLSVDTGTWMQAMSDRVEAWIHDVSDEEDLDSMEAAMDPDDAEAIYELERCIECGCCVAACGTARMRDDFVGAVAINKIARFRLDPRDSRTDQEFYELIGNDEGVFGCMALLGCNDYCPKELPLQTQIAFLRRKMLAAGLRR